MRSGPPWGAWDSSVTSVIDAFVAAAEFPGGFTFIGAGGPKHVSFADLVRRCSSLATRILASGLEPGSRIAIVVRDQEQFVEWFLGAMFAGCVPTPVAPATGLGAPGAHAARVAGMLRSVEPAAVVADERTARGLGSEVPILRRSALPSPDYAMTLPKPAPSDDAYIQFTSGSTNAPRAIRVTHAALLANVAAIGTSGLCLDPRVDRAVSWLPFHHDMGLVGFLITPLAFAIPTWYLPTSKFARDPLSWLELVSENRATITYAPTFAWNRAMLLADDSRLDAMDLSSLRAAGCGAEPVKPAVLTDFASRFARAGFAFRAFTPSYGLAEVTLAVSIAPPGDEPLVTQLPAYGTGNSTRRTAIGCGRPLPGFEVLVVDECGQPVPDGAEGELLIRSPSLASGYEGDPGATAERFRDGWLHTGDIGALIDGQIVVSGRLGDFIIINGRNIAPHHLEWELADRYALPDECVVAVGLPGEATETLVVVIETPPGFSPLDIRAALPAHPVIDGIAAERVEVVELGGIPRTTSGKVRRSELARMLLASESISVPSPS